MLKDKQQELKKQIILQADLVTGMLGKCKDAFTTRNEELLDEIIKIDEEKVNAAQNDIEENCVSTIALFQPEAKNLRVVLMILKMTDDLERIGDLVTNICESFKLLVAGGEIKNENKIVEMIDRSTEMLNNSIKSFIEEDSALAQNVCKSDDIVDDLNALIIKDIMAYIVSNPADIERGFGIVRISHNLERIADLSTNIAEDAVYIGDGVVIKHHKDEI